MIRLKLQLGLFHVIPYLGNRTCDPGVINITFKVSNQPILNFLAITKDVTIFLGAVNTQGQNSLQVQVHIEIK